MRHAAPLLLCLVILGGSAAAAPEPGRVQLDSPATVQGLWLRDVDGDGAQDVLLLEGRHLRVFAGRDGALPPSAPRWTVDLGADVTFVDVLPPDETGPGLLTFGLEGAQRVPLGGGRPTPVAGTNEALDWADRDQANFAPLVGAGGILLPTPRGVTWHGPGDETTALVVPRFREVVPAGGFLEDTSIVTEALPQVWTRANGTSPPALWALGGTRLLGPAGVSYDLGFLPRDGTRRLTDLNGDGRPDVIHDQGTNRERTYAFFLTPPAGGDLRPPATVLRLAGWSRDPEFVDLDADGLQDLVITTLAVDARNTMRALGGQVTASTKAFLNQGGGKPFAATPNVSIASDVGVAIRFTPGGRLQIQRSLTILARGDYDGDGRRDLAIRTGDETLTVRRGVPGRAVWTAAGREIRIPPVEGSPGVVGHAADLTGDGRDEIVLLYQQAHGGRDRVWVVQP